jgi:very-short-patch-repair endonuclease
MAIITRSRSKPDTHRTLVMESHGWRVARFAANYVLTNPEGIWTEIDRLLRDDP